MKNIGWNLTGENLFVVLDGKTRTIPRSSPHFDIVYRAIDENDVDTVSRYMDAKAHLTVETEGRVTFDGAHLMFNGEVMHNSIVTRLTHLWEKSLPFTSLLKLFDNLMENPSNRAVTGLYDFLEACSLPITSDGCFLAYKKVRANFTDIHSGKFDNSVGQSPTVRRNEVDEDPNRTCSHGLHVCSRSYLPMFGGNSGTKIVMVKVNPADVVAVPTDYNNAKMRVCKYEVVQDITNEYNAQNDPMPEYSTSLYSPIDAIDDYFDSLGDYFDGTDDVDDDFEDLVTDSTAATTSAKLDEKKVRDIKALLSKGELPIVRIAEIYDVNESTIRKIRNGQTWKGVS